MSVSLVEVMVAASKRLAPLTAECAGHLVLAAADQLMENARTVSARNLCIEDSGTVRITGGNACDDEACELALRQLLGRLLDVARSGGVALARIGRRAPEGGVARLIRELELALVPANRAAARRSLARLHRETFRALADGLVVELDEGPASVDPSLDESTIETGLLSSPVASVRQVSATRRAEALAPRPLVEAVPQPSASEARSVPSVASPQDDDPGLAEIDVEFSEQPPAVTGDEPAPAAAPPFDGQILESSVCAPASLEPETPAEPVVGRRARLSVLAAPELPDIHKTPYLGTLVAPLPDGAGWAHAYGTNRDWNTGLTPAPVSEEDVTEPTPPATEWLDSDELEELSETEDAESSPDPGANGWWASPQPAAGEALGEPAPARFPAPESDVRDLLDRFRVADAHPTDELLHDLKRLAGLSATPPPVAVACAERAAWDPAALTPRTNTRVSSPEPETAGVLVPVRPLVIEGT